MTDGYNVHGGSVWRRIIESLLGRRAHRAVGRISSAEGGYVVRGARTGRIVPSRSSREPSMVGKPRSEGAQA